VQCAPTYTRTLVCWDLLFAGLHCAGLPIVNFTEAFGAAVNAGLGTYYGVFLARCSAQRAAVC